MNTLDMVSAGALAMLGLILLILLILLFQYLRLRSIWQMMLVCRSATRWLRIWEKENMELHSALRAEKAHVEQLKRKMVLLQALIPAA